MSEATTFKVSPTKIKEYTRCPRLWFFNYVLNLKPEATAKMSRGTEVHEKLELYYIKGIIPEEPKLQKVLELAPPRHEKVMSETWLPVELPGNILVRQKADIIDLRDPTHPVVYDFKTMGNFNYALESQQLAEDIQLISYAYAVVSTYCPEATMVSVAHIQIPMDISDGPRKVETTISIVDVLEKWCFTESKYIAEMFKDSTKHVSEVKANFGSACNAFGGCPHQARCALVELKGKECNVMEETKVVDRLRVLGSAVELTKTTAPKGATVESLAKELPQRVDTMFDIDVLYVDCLPLTGRDAVECFSDIVAEAAQAVAQVTKIPDWRLHEFGKGKGFIAVQLGTMVLPKQIYVSSREDLSALALELLAPRANQVIVGVK
jgi:hypothetical protein